VINDGLPGNVVHLEEPAQAHERQSGVTAYHA
jgi:hypothetical protein